MEDKKKTKVCYCTISVSLSAHRLVIYVRGVDKSEKLLRRVHFVSVMMRGFHTAASEMSR